jgi:diguanylate cyclase (GGDEF)-like protein/PAS domain S-box-containing protein
MSMRGRTVGVLSPLLVGTYFGGLISGARRAAAAAGGQVVVVQTFDEALEHAFLDGGNRIDVNQLHLGERDHVAWDAIAGFVVIMDAVQLTYLHDLRAAGKPVVTISRSEPSFPCPVVLPDNIGGTSEAVRHLWDHGHRRIAFVGNTRQYDVNERYETYCSTLRSMGAEPSPDLFFPVPGNLECDGQAGAEAMIAAGLRSTAVFVATDFCARGVIEALCQAGYAVPDDQAVVSFDDLPDSALMSPALASVAQNFEEVGATAADLLYRQLDGTEVHAGLHRVSTHFVPRESCGCSDGLAATGTREAHDGTAAFTKRLAEILCPPGTAEPRVREVSDVGSEMKRTFATSLDRELTSPELVQIGQLCRQLHTDATLPGVFVSLLVLGRRLVEEMEERATSPEAVSRIGLCMYAVALGLLKAGLSGMVHVSQAEQLTTRSEDAVAFNLLNTRKDPRSLEWLANSTAQAAMLALWCAHDHDLGLEVAGQYEARGATPYSGPSRLSVEDFPPFELVALANEEPRAVTYVLPVRAGTTYWGYLALVAPVQSTFSSRETLFHWSALLGLALELRTRTEDLALSFEREREMAQSVKRSEERYALAASAANDGLWDWDLVNGSVYYSDRWKEMFGYAPDAIGESPQEWLGRVHPDDLGDLLGLLDERRAGARGAFDNEHRVRAADGEYRWVLCRGLGVPGRGTPATRLVGSLTDVTERRCLQEQLEHQALYDALTGLPNRVLFLDRLSQAMARARRDTTFEYAVVWLDLDGFKLVNDSLGHVLGDVLLQSVADRLRSHVREVDTAARFGGDEFAILLCGTSGLSLRTVMDRLQEQLTLPYDLDGHEVVVTASIGMSTSKAGHESPEDVMRDVDTAMYRAKATGRTGPGAFEAPRHRSVPGAGPGFNGAVGEGQLELHYQPVVRTRTGALVGVEALVRWRHPEHGLLLPSEFLPAAEESGLVLPMGRWVLAEACRQLHDWASAGAVSGPFQMSVNLSGREFWDSALIAQVDKVLEATPVRSGGLALEVTESTVARDVDRAARLMAELRTRGVRTCIDGFAAGYSALGALHRLPVDVIKVDRSFVADLRPGVKSSKLVRAVVRLARDLGAEMVAVGVETAEQQQVLADTGCPRAQGHYFFAPLSADELGATLATYGPGARPAARTASRQRAGPRTGRGRPTGKSQLRRAP